MSIRIAYFFSIYDCYPENRLPLSLTHNYLPNSTLLVGDKWACFLIEPLAKNGVAGSENYKALAVLRQKIVVWEKFIYFNKRMFGHQISFCFS